MIERGSDQISPAEFERHQWDVETFDKQLEQQRFLKEREVELAKLDTKWASWLRIPLVIITLPIRILFVIPLTVYAATKQEVPEFYQRFFK